MTGLKTHNTTVKKTVTLTNDTDAYSANDVIGGKITIAIPSGILRRVKITDDDNEGAALELYLFDADPSTIADDAAFSLAIGDLDKMIKRLTLASADYYTNNSNKVGWFKDGTTDSLGIDYVSGGNLYAYLVCTATPTLAAASYKLHFTFWTNPAGGS